MVDDYTPIAEMQAGKKYDQTYLIETANPKRDRKKRPYILLQVKDVTGSTRVFVWDTKMTPAIAPGRYVHMSATAEDYQEDIVLKTHNLTPVPKPRNTDQYVKGANPRVLDVYEKELRRYIDEIDDVHYTNLVGYAIEHAKIVEKLRQGAFGSKGPLSHVGGLLIHTVDLLRATIGAADALQSVDAPISRSLLIAGCIFRNLGYHSTIRPVGDGWEVTDYGRLTGLRYASADFVRDCCMSTDSAIGITIPEGKRLAIQSLCKTEEDPCNVAEAKLIMATEKFVGAMHYAANTRRLYTEHLKDD